MPKLVKMCVTSGEASSVRVILCYKKANTNKSSLTTKLGDVAVTHSETAHSLPDDSHR